MNFEDTINSSFFHYHSLSMTPKEHKYLVMNHLFFVVANGFEWVKGELIENTFGKKRQDWVFFLQESLEEIERLSKTKTPGFKFYPISLRYAFAFNVPANVKQDWLKAIIQYLEFAYNAPFEYFYYDIHGQYYDGSDEENIHWARKSKRNIKKQFNRLKKQHEKMYG